MSVEENQRCIKFGKLRNKLSLIFKQSKGFYANIVNVYNLINFKWNFCIQQNCFYTLINVVTTTSTERCKLCYSVVSYYLDTAVNHFNWGLPYIRFFCLSQNLRKSYWNIFNLRQSFLWIQKLRGKAKIGSSQKLSDMRYVSYTRTCLAKVDL